MWGLFVSPAQNPASVWCNHGAFSINERNYWCWLTFYSCVVRHSLWQSCQCPFLQLLLPLHPTLWTPNTCSCVHRGRAESDSAWQKLWWGKRTIMEPTGEAVSLIVEGVGCKWKIVKEVSDEAVKSSQLIWIRGSNSSWGPSRGSTWGKQTLWRSKEELQDVFKWRMWPMWAFWNQATILGELACMALFLPVFLVIVGLFRRVCWICSCVLSCLHLWHPLYFHYPPPEPGFVSPPYDWCAVGERL